MNTIQLIVKLYRMRDNYIEQPIEKSSLNINKNPPPPVPKYTLTDLAILQINKELSDATHYPVKITIKPYELCLVGVKSAVHIIDLFQCIKEIYSLKGFKVTGYYTDSYNTLVLTFE